MVTTALAALAVDDACTVIVLLACLSLGLVRFVSLSKMNGANMDGCLPFNAQVSK
jgi:hypothetical protein